MSPWIVVALAIAAAWSIDASIGFGSVVIALSISALVLPLTVVMPVLVPLNILLSGYLSIRYHKHIDWRLLLVTILPAMLIGAGVGLSIAGHFTGDTLRLLFGAIVVWFSTRSLWQIFKGNHGKEHHPLLTLIITFFAGITHGLFASGGPLLVYSLTGINSDKRRFRATLSAVWFSLNSTLTVWFIISGAFFTNLSKTLSFIPIVIVAIIFGEWLHHRVSEGLFKKIVLFVLLITGIILLVK